MEKALDIIFGLVIVKVSNYVKVSNRKAVKAFLNTFNNLVFVEVVRPVAVVGDKVASEWFVSGTTGYIVFASRFAVKGVCEYGFHAISLGNDRWIIAKAKGLRIVDENGESINKTGEAQSLSSLLAKYAL